MKRKLISIVLALTLVAALIVTPALAAENGSELCPLCGEIIDPYANNEIYSSITISSCRYYSGSHAHAYYRLRWYYSCDNCGYYNREWASSNSGTYCDATNNWMRIDTVDQIM